MKVVVETNMVVGEAAVKAKVRHDSGDDDDDDDADINLGLIVQ